MVSYITYIFIIIVCLPVFTVAQDHIITWKDDTIACRMPGRPGKEKFRPAYKYENGHIRIIAMFEGDSSALLEPHHIKGYYREKHGRSLLCNGNFESAEITEADRKLLYFRDDDRSRYFLNRLVDGKYVSLYVIYLAGYRAPVSYYFLHKPDSSGRLRPVLIRNRKKLLSMLDDPGIVSRLSSKKITKRRYASIVAEYNRLKATASEE